MLYIVKKTLDEFDKHSVNFVIQVKRNQLHLFNRLKEDAQNQDLLLDTSQECCISKGRKETRKITVFKTSDACIYSKFKNLSYFTKCERIRQVKGKSSQEVSFYISNLFYDAEKMGQIIRNHWQIENNLHRIKDVQMLEDASRIGTGQAAQNMSIIRNIVVNIFGLNKVSSIKYTTEILANNPKQASKMIKNT